MAKIIKYILIVGQAYGLVETVNVVSNITDPIQVVITAREMLTD